MPENAPARPVALALSTHPGPTLAVTVVTAVLAVGAGLDLWRVVLITVAVFLGQVSVGLSNDWIDAERDAAVGRSDKPIARGWIDVGTVRVVSVVTAVLAVVLTVPLGWGATLAHVMFMASAWVYNAWLKRSAFSVLPFVVSFGLLPAVVTLSAETPRFAPWWMLAAGALLGIAAHFANVLPDLADDAATGVSGLPHRLGRRASGLTIAVALGVASVLVVFGAGDPGAVQWMGLALSLALAVVCGWLALTRPPTRLLFQLIMTGALVDVALLALAP
jgi:4-hydroxybenzoate polyprenyltransferase